MKNKKNKMMYMRKTKVIEEGSLEPFNELVISCVTMTNRTISLICYLN